MFISFTEDQSNSHEYRYQKFEVRTTSLRCFEVLTSTDGVAAFELNDDNCFGLREFIMIAADLYDPILYVCFRDNTISVAVGAVPAGGTPLQQIRLQASYTEEEANAFARTAFPDRYAKAPLTVKVIGASLDVEKTMKLPELL